MGARTGKAGWLVPSAVAALIVAGAAAGAGPLITSTRGGPPQGPPGVHGVPKPVVSQRALPLPTGSAAHPEPTSAAVGASAIDAIWAVLTAALLALLLVIAVAAIIRQLRIVGRTRSADEEPVEGASGTRAGDEAVRRRLRSDVEAALADLDESADPREAVLACWLRLEAAVARTGTARAPAETSAELARRVLTAYAVERSPLDRLHRLYQVARYSTAPVPTQAREEARAALDGVRRDIERGLAPATTSSGPT